jgi:hypothetical protein
MKLALIWAENGFVWLCFFGVYRVKIGFGRQKTMFWRNSGSSIRLFFSMEFWHTVIHSINIG